MMSEFTKTRCKSKRQINKILVNLREIIEIRELIQGANPTSPNAFYLTRILVKQSFVKIFLSYKFIQSNFVMLSLKPNQTSSLDSVH